MSLSKINKKTIARLAAVQAIYQYTLQNSQQNIDDIAQKVIAFYQDENINNEHSLKITLNIGHFDSLVKLVIKNLEDIDQIISAHLTTTKNLSYMPVLLVALFRVSVCELLFFANIPAKVVINEFTDIAHEMLNENEIGFVNSMLDKIAKEN
jgi:N utilization substance protein B